MRFNKPVVAVSIGALATVAGELVSLAFVAMGLMNYDIYSIDSLFITANRYNLMLGIVSDFIVGGAIAVLLNWALSRYGADYIVSKAIMFTLAAWFILRLYSIAFIEGRFVDPRSIQDHWLHFVSTIITGIILGLLFKWSLLRKQNK